MNQNKFMTLKTKKKSSKMNNLLGFVCHKGDEQDEDIDIWIQTVGIILFVWHHRLERRNFVAHHNGKELHCLSEMKHHAISTTNMSHHLLLRLYERWCSVTDLDEN